MGKHAGYEFSRKTGHWVKKKSTKAHDYDDIVEENGDAWALLISFFRWYPDYMMDIFACETPEIRLQLFQRVEMRARARYQEVFTTGSRGFTKTFISFSEQCNEGILFPGSKLRYVGPADNQQAALASDAWAVYKRNYPALANHYNVRSSAMESFNIYTELGSTISIDSTRGDNCHALLVEEVGQEELPKFNHENYRRVVRPTLRLQHMVDGEPDRTHIDFKVQAITSASRQQNDAFAMRNEVRKNMKAGKSAWAVDYPWQVPVLTMVRPYKYYAELKAKMTPDEFLRECCSRYTGTSENPIVRESVLTDSQKQLTMETEHCGDPMCWYVIGYDVSYADGAQNAKCATSVIKGTFQSERLIERSRLLKTIVYVMDSPPPKSAEDQARILKRKWADYSLDGGNPTYIVVDSWQYGKSVVEALHRDLGDGLPPLCCINHDFMDLEQKGALPVIYALKATAGQGGNHDPDSAMLRYAEIEWEAGNIRMLTTDVNEGVRAYKELHGIKDDMYDVEISLPYRKTRELCEQMANLKKKVAGMGISETRISGHINRDMWSATKYALRMFDSIEHDIQAEAHRDKDDWQPLIARFKDGGSKSLSAMGNRNDVLIPRSGGVARINGDGWRGVKK